MNIEELSKSQIVLLVLLVSFVTSIATGIVTVALMDQAPPVVAQTVNRVVERTVEKVVPSTQGAAVAAIVPQEKTVIVNQSDLVAGAVGTVNPSIVRLYSVDTTNPVFLGLGVVINSTGVIATDATIIGDSGEANAVLSDGTQVRTFKTSANKSSGLAFLTSATSSVLTPKWIVAKIAPQSAILGETVIGISGKTATRIAQGIVTTLTPQSDPSSPAIFETDISAESIMYGSPLINESGELVGISTGVSRAVADAAFVPVSFSIPSSKK